MLKVVVKMSSEIPTNPELPQRFHPCLGYPLNKASKWIAQINMAFSLAFFIVILGMQILFVIAFEEVKDVFIRLDKDSTGYTILVTIFPILVLFVLVSVLAVCIASIYLNFFLYEGVKQKNCKRIQLWLAIAAAHLLLVFIISVSLSALFPKPLMMIVFETLEIIYLSYALWVVYEFQRERETQPSGGSGLTMNANYDGLYHQI